MEEEPTTLENAMKITGKKEKVMNLMKENRGKGNTSKEKQSNLDYTRNQSRNNYNYHANKNYSNHSLSNNEKNKSSKNNNFNNQNMNYFNSNYKKSYNNNNEQNNKSYYNQNKSLSELNNNQKRKLNNDEIDEITKKLSDLKINFCVNCMRIGHTVNECIENEDNNNHLN